MKYINVDELLEWARKTAFDPEYPESAGLLGIDSLEEYVDQAKGIDVDNDGHVVKSS